MTERKGSRSRQKYFTTTEHSGLQKTKFNSAVKLSAHPSELQKHSVLGPCHWCKHMKRGLQGGREEVWVQPQLHPFTTGHHCTEAISSCLVLLGC